MKKAVLAAVAVVVIALVGVGSWAAFGADDEASVRGTCGGSSYVLAARTTTTASRSPSSCSPRLPARSGT